VEVARLFLCASACELHQEYRGGFTDNGRLDDRAKCGVRPGELDHGSVDQLDRDGSKLDDVLRRFHCGVERREIHDTERLVLRERSELQLKAGEISERAFRADQQMREIYRSIASVRAHALRIEHVEFVAADATQQRRELVRDPVVYALADRLE